MGVRFLESYLENDSRTACYKVRIPDLVKDYRRKTNNSVPVIVVDGMSCLRPLYSKLSWLNGGQYKEFQNVVEKFINSFAELGCELVVYYDGPVQNIKLPVWKKRRLQSAEALSDIFDKLNKSEETEHIEVNSRQSFLPNGIAGLFLFVLSQHKNCRIVKSLRECDEEVAHFAFSNKCFAILAQDTDYVIYRGAMYYLSSKHFDVERMTTLCYDGYNLANELGINVDLLPLFASLSGNDIIEFETLRYFHSGLRRRYQKRSSILLVAEFIKNQWNIDISQIAYWVFGTTDYAELLHQSLQSYDLCRMSQEVSEGLSSSNSSWNNILQCAKERHIKSHYTASLFDILFFNRFTSSTILEDYRPNKSILPIGELLKEIRRISYGILLHEKPRDNKKVFVKELIMTGFESMEDFKDVEPIYLKKVKHPGLLALWTSEDKQIQDIRWEILGEVFRSEPREVKHLPSRLIVPSLAARYVRVHAPDLADWELNAFIATSVCVKGYKAQDLAQLPSYPLTYRSIWLYSALSRTCSLVTSLFYFIGEPVSCENTLPSQYTDGKLFHEKYRQSEKGASVESLCEYQVESIECFNMLKHFITR